jgi:hypothetical protein
MKIQKRLSVYGTATILIADMTSVCALVRTWKTWENVSINDNTIFRWATALLFVVSVVIVPIVYIYCSKIDASLSSNEDLKDKPKPSQRRTRK